MNNVNGNIFNIQRFSLNDGNGIRTIVFLKGCPLKCQWCHNPESHNKSDDIYFDNEKCVCCGKCVNVCENGCHKLYLCDDGKPAHIYDRLNCIKCGKCTEVCLNKALEKVGKTVTVDYVIGEVLKDEIFYKQSGGGMTVSGGEPLAQPEFLTSLCKAAKEKGLDVAIETSGYGKKETLENILPFVDCFLFDYKAEPEDYYEYTGVKFDMIYENLKFLSENSAKIVLRCPIIPLLNDNEKHYKGIAELAKELEGVCLTELEAYHPLGISKCERLGKTQKYNNREFLNSENLKEVCEKIAEISGKQCRMG